VKFIKNSDLFIIVLQAGKSKVEWPISDEGLCAASSHGGRTRVQKRARGDLAYFLTNSFSSINLVTRADPS
jgi:hypothetical protein